MCVPLCVCVIFFLIKHTKTVGHWGGGSIYIYIYMEGLCLGSLRFISPHSPSGQGVKLSGSDVVGRSCPEPEQRWRRKN